MEERRVYQRLLDKMLLLEKAGNIIYRSLARKVKDEKMGLIYEKLALREEEAAQYIENEISAINRNRSTSVNDIILGLTKLICGMLTARQIAWILKIILKKRMYSKWYNNYSDKNRNFWNLLLDHENLQYELLKIILG